MEAKQLFIDAWVGQGHGSRVPSNLTKQDKLNAMLVLSVYNGMLTRDEKHLMNRAENADTRTDARKKAIEVEEKVVEMCSELYEAAGKKPPKTLQPPSVPKQHAGGWAAGRNRCWSAPWRIQAGDRRWSREGRGGSLGEGASQGGSARRTRTTRGGAGRPLSGPREAPRGADSSPRSSPGS